jgi:CRP/FNR family transcriptional regulator
MSTILKALQGNPVFQMLNKVEREEFARLAIIREFHRGEYLCHNGDAWPYLFLIDHGQIAAVKESAEGRSLLVAIFEANEIFWGPTFFIEELLMPVALMARKSSQIFIWNRQICVPFLLKNGALSWELSQLMVRRMLHASDIVEELAFQSVTGRLARLLLEQYPSDQQAVERYLTLDEMAARTGTTREMVCRILYRFAAQGAIQINRTEFIFTNRELLEKHI